MNSIKWSGDETVDDLYDHWITLIENGNRVGLLKEIHHGLHNHEKGHVVDDNGDLQYIGDPISTDEMVIIELAYGRDVDKVTDMIRDSDEHNVGDNLK